MLTDQDLFPIDELFDDTIDPPSHSTSFLSSTVSPNHMSYQSCSITSIPLALLDDKSCLITLEPLKSSNQSVQKSNAKYGVSQNDVLSMLDMDCMVDIDTRISIHEQTDPVAQERINRTRDSYLAEHKSSNIINQVKPQDFWFCNQQDDTLGFGCLSTAQRLDYQNDTHKSAKIRDLPVDRQDGTTSTSNDLLLSSSDNLIKHACNTEPSSTTVHTTRHEEKQDCRDHDSSSDSNRHIMMTKSCQHNVTLQPCEEQPSLYGDKSSCSNVNNHVPIVLPVPYPMVESNASSRDCPSTEQIPTSRNPHEDDYDLQQPMMRTTDVVQPQSDLVHASLSVPSDNRQHVEIISIDDSDDDDVISIEDSDDGDDNTEDYVLISSSPISSDTVSVDMLDHDDVPLPWNGDMDKVYRSHDLQHHDPTRPCSTNAHPQYHHDDCVMEVDKEGHDPISDKDDFVATDDTRAIAKTDPIASAPPDLDDDMTTRHNSPLSCSVKETTTTDHDIPRMAVNYHDNIVDTMHCDSPPPLPNSNNDAPLSTTCSENHAATCMVTTTTQSSMTPSVEQILASHGPQDANMHSTSPYIAHQIDIDYGTVPRNGPKTYEKNIRKQVIQKVIAQMRSCVIEPFYRYPFPVFKFKKKQNLLPEGPQPRPMENMVDYLSLFPDATYTLSEEFLLPSTDPVIATDTAQNNTSSHHKVPTSSSKKNTTTKSLSKSPSPASNTSLMVNPYVRMHNSVALEHLLSHYTAPDPKTIYVPPHYSATKVQNLFNDTANESRKPYEPLTIEQLERIQRMGDTLMKHAHGIVFEHAVGKRLFDLGLIRSEDRLFAILVGYWVGVDHNDFYSLVPIFYTSLGVLQRARYSLTQHFAKYYAKLDKKNQLLGLVQSNYHGFIYPNHKNNYVHGSEIFDDDYLCGIKEFHWNADHMKPLYPRVPLPPLIGTVRLRLKVPANTISKVSTSSRTTEQRVVHVDTIPSAIRTKRSTYASRTEGSKKRARSPTTTTKNNKSATKNQTATPPPTNKRRRTSLHNKNV